VRRVVSWIEWRQPVGLQHQFMALRCRPAELLPAVALPRDLAVWGIDSGVRHAVSGTDYGAVRIGAFMGYRVIAARTDVALSYSDGVAVIDDPRWRGYLANITPSEFVQTYAQYLPDVMRGDEFLARYTATSDVVTTVRSRYRLCGATAHVAPDCRASSCAALCAFVTDRHHVLNKLLCYSVNSCISHMRVIVRVV
jgi:hypothetical protein